MSKYCGNCGAKMDDAAKVCGMCGYRFSTVETINPISQRIPTETASVTQTDISSNSNHRSVRVPQIVVSVLAILNVMFVPIFDVWGGLFPSNPDSNFWDVISGNCESDEWVFIFTLAILIPSGLMLLCSILKAKVLARIAGFWGLICLIALLVRFVSEYEFSYLFDFDDGNLCIGLWIGLLLFVVMACIPTKKKQFKTKYKK